MTALLNTLTSFSFTNSTRPASQDAGEVEFQAVFAAIAVLLAGGTAATLLALAHAL